MIDVLCCMPAALTAADMREVHVLNHHRYNDGPGDVTSTEGRERGLRAVWYWIRYGVDRQEPHRTNDFRSQCRRPAGASGATSS